MHKISSLSVVTALVFCFSGVATATVTQREVVTFTNGIGNAVNRLLIDFDNQLGTSQLYLTLTQGTVVGTQVVDNPVRPKAPIAASDNLSYITLGEDTFTGLVPTALTPGASSGLGGPGGTFVWEPTVLDIAWAPNPPVPTDGQNFLAAQIVLSSDAVGEWNINYTSGDGVNFLMLGGEVLGGAMVPEPGTLSLVLLGLCAIVGGLRRRR